MTPTTNNLCSASYYAGRISEDAHAAFWLERTNGPNAAKHLRRNMLDNLKKLAAMFDYQLTEIDAEPEQLDAETLAASGEYTERQIVDAGRGELAR